MDEAIRDAIEELKRVDHLIYVSLKYTRTVDVIRSVINRLIDSYNAIIDGLLEILDKNNKIEEIPVAPMVKINLLKEKYPDSELEEYLDLYLYLRKLYRAKYSARSEFRKGVTMISDLDKPVETNIESVMEFFEKTKKFIEFIREFDTGE